MRVENTDFESCLGTQSEKAGELRCKTQSEAACHSVPATPIPIQSPHPSGCLVLWLLAESGQLEAPGEDGREKPGSLVLLSYNILAAAGVLMEDSSSAETTAISGALAPTPCPSFPWAWGGDSPPLLGCFSTSCCPL